jgi:hypothetical protein
MFRDTVIALGPMLTMGSPLAHTLSTMRHAPPNA